MLVVLANHALVHDRTERQGWQGGAPCCGAPVSLSSGVRWPVADGGTEPGMGCQVDGAVTDLGVGRKASEMVAATPVVRRPDWPSRETSATVRADVVQELHARGAEGALERADPRLLGVGRQRAVAVLAGRSKGEHQSSSGRLHQGTKCGKRHAAPDAISPLPPPPTSGSRAEPRPLGRVWAGREGVGARC
jgi:hypothetical protein